LQAAKEKTWTLHYIAEEGPTLERREREKTDDQVRKKELESQKARIVAQMVPASRGMGDNQENVPPAGSKKTKGKEREAAKPETGLGK
jgi:cell cycle serine/threonine-protein kinase CDC5/MSD2